jgi:RND family efflux transporter MFP subunit
MNTSSPRFNLRPWTVSAALILLVGLAACTEKAAPTSRVQPVLVSTVHNAPSGQAREFTGVLRARHEAELGFRAGGKVVARLVEVGQAVKAGQALARLDPGDYELALRAAEDQWRAARVDAEQAAADAARFKRLLVDHSVSTADHERQQARAEAAAAHQAQAARQLELARNQTRYTTLLAEFDGVITALRFEVGQVVAEGQPLIGLARSDELEVVADLPEDLATKARDYTATASLWDVPERILPLKLRELSPAAAARSRTFQARFSLLDKSPATRQRLRLGMTANLHLARDDGEALARLPASALLKSNGTPVVWQVDGSGRRLIAQPVQVAGFSDETVLLRGLADGARVVTAGIQKLDAAIEVVPIARTASGMNLSAPLVRTAKANPAGEQP